MEICERDSHPRGIKQRRNYCERCESYLTKSTFYCHRSKYYNTATGKWVKVCDITVSSSSTSSDEDMCQINGCCHKMYCERTCCQ